MKKEIVRNTLKVFAVGITALLMAATAGFLVYLAIVLFFHIPNITGYLAVGAFAGALVAFAGALGAIYMCGAWMVRQGKFAR